MKLYLIAFIAILTACSKPDEKIIDPTDYQTYLIDANFTFSSEAETISFWEKRFESNNQDQTAILKLAGLYAARFKSQSNIEDIHLSDSLYKVVIQNTPFGKAGIYQGLAANAVTQHQFKKANAYLEAALIEGEKKASTYLMLADVRMELGDVQGAKTILGDFKNKNSFAFLIRDAKIKDKEGKLDTAILWMEKGVERVGENKSLYCWTKSNLADMYGHAGRVQESYNTYLDVLKADPSYLYALKRIAWIAFSHDHNYKEAKRIVNFIRSQKPAPDLYLLLAEIAAAEKNLEEKNSMLALFEQEVADPRYGAMYNKYMTLLMADEHQQPQKALNIAMEEVKSRPTAESYDLLAWSLFKNGDTDGALKIASEHLEGRSFEPEALYHMGIMYAKVDQDISKKYLKDALLSSFELGPAITTNIKTTLKNL